MTALLCEQGGPDSPFDLFWVLRCYTPLEGVEEQDTLIAQKANAAIFELLFTFWFTTIEMRTNVSSAFERMCGSLDDQTSLPNEPQYSILLRVLSSVDSGIITRLKVNHYGV